MSRADVARTAHCFEVIQQRSDALLVRGEGGLCAGGDISEYAGSLQHVSPRLP
jgi:enoyl-CoA hydratase/carnithine racemase